MKAVPFCRPSHQDGHVDMDMRREQDGKAATGGLRAHLALGSQHLERALQVLQVGALQPLVRWVLMGPKVSPFLRLQEPG